MLDEPLPMSLPAILVNPKPAAVSYPRLDSRASGSRSIKPLTSTKRAQGRRARLRKENDSLAGNPHAVAPSRHDLPLAPQRLPPPIFPSPLPPSLLPRTRPAPSPALPSSEPGSTEAGSFSMSLKGIRRTLQRRGARAEDLCKIVEDELTSWKKEVRREVIVFSGRPHQSNEGGRIVDAFLVPTPARDSPSTPYQSASGRAGPLPLDMVSRSFDHDGFCPAIVELARSEGSLTWAIAEGFERYVVHCVARYHGLVTFSKTSPYGTRLTYILVRPSRVPARSSDRTVTAGTLDTPPTTDMSSVGGSGTDTDRALFTDGQSESEVETGWGGWDSENERLEEVETRAEEEKARLLARPTGLVSTVPKTLELVSLANHHDLEADVESSDDESASSTTDALASSLVSLDFVSTPSSPSTLSHDSYSSSMSRVIRPSSLSFLSSAIAEDEEEDADQTLTSSPSFETSAHVDSPTIDRTKEDASPGPVDDEEGRGRHLNGKSTRSFWQYVYG
ncbi:hypothetical protein [Phaffia rhodozyma]|uniref:R3H domain-containing protein n=1 Tax=Phaffia rhodozyma TaxID=264483 RepID=A0A0F7SGH6_PHARH|nr:hypothetical protein [Phaffia rhodozyma]CED82293.1 hypothetical protein [Phaffia rhodozyma]